MATRQPLATAQEVADFLGVPVGTIYNWRTRRVGPPAVKAGQQLRFRWPDVDAWLDARSGKAA